MDATVIYDLDYNDYIAYIDDPTKYSWAASHVFNLTTYDDSLDELFIKKIIEVCNAILDGKNFEYIKNEDNYISYILVCQLLNDLQWIEWGTSIRGSWFQEQHYGAFQSKPILKYYNGREGEQIEVPFTINNLRELIKFIEKE